MNESHREMQESYFVTNFECGQQHLEVTASLKLCIFSALEVPALRSVLWSQGPPEPAEVGLGFLL